MVPIKLGAAARRKSTKQDLGYQWIIRNMNGYEIWIMMDKKGDMIGYERISSLISMDKIG